VDVENIYLKMHHLVCIKEKPPNGRNEHNIVNQLHFNKIN